MIEEFDRILSVKLNMPSEYIKEIVDYLKSFEIHKYSCEESPFELRDKYDEKVLAMD